MFSSFLFGYYYYYCSFSIAFVERKLPSQRRPWVPKKAYYSTSTVIYHCIGRRWDSPDEDGRHCARKGRAVTLGTTIEALLLDFHHRRVRISSSSASEVFFFFASLVLVVVVVSLFFFFLFILFRIPSSLTLINISNDSVQSGTRLQPYCHVVQMANVWFVVLQHKSINKQRNKRSKLGMQKNIVYVIRMCN